MPSSTGPGEDEDSEPMGSLIWTSDPEDEAHGENAPNQNSPDAGDADASDASNENGDHSDGNDSDASESEGRSSNSETIDADTEAGDQTDEGEETEDVGNANGESHSGGDNLELTGQDLHEREFQIVNPDSVEEVVFVSSEMVGGSVGETREFVENAYQEVKESVGKAVGAVEEVAHSVKESVVEKANDMAVLGKESVEPMSQIAKEHRSAVLLATACVGVGFVGIGWVGLAGLATAGVTVSAPGAAVIASHGATVLVGLGQTMSSGLALGLHLTGNSRLSDDASNAGNWMTPSGIAIGVASGAAGVGPEGVHAAAKAGALVGGPPSSSRTLEIADAILDFSEATEVTEAMANSRSEEKKDGRK